MKGIGQGGSAKALGRGLRATIEKTCADVLNNGFSNTGYDGVALFANTHPLADSATNGDNLTTGTLTDANLKTGLILMRDTRDEANVLMMAMPKNLIVPPELEYTAKAILMSERPAGELSNDTNTCPRLNLVVLDYLTSSTAWFIQAGNLDNLMFMWREAPMFDSQKIQKTVDYFMYGYSRFVGSYVDWRGLVGSLGT